MDYGITIGNQRKKKKKLKYCVPAKNCYKSGKTDLLENKLNKHASCKWHLKFLFHHEQASYLIWRDFQFVDLRVRVFEYPLTYSARSLPKPNPVIKASCGQNNTHFCESMWSENVECTCTPHTHTRQQWEVVFHEFPKQSKDTNCWSLVCFCGFYPGKSIRYLLIKFLLLGQFFDIVAQIHILCLQFSIEDKRWNCFIYDCWYDVMAISVWKILVNNPCPTLSRGSSPGFGGAGKIFWVLP